MTLYLFHAIALHVIEHHLAVTAHTYTCIGIHRQCLRILNWVNVCGETKNIYEDPSIGSFVERKKTTKMKYAMNNGQELFASGKEPLEDEEEKKDRDSIRDYCSEIIKQFYGNSFRCWCVWVCALSLLLICVCVLFAHCSCVFGVRSFPLSSNSTIEDKR